MGGQVGEQRRVSKWNEDERHEAEIESWRRKDVIYFRNDGSVM